MVSKYQSQKYYLSCVLYVCVFGVCSHLFQLYLRVQELGNSTDEFGIHEQRFSITEDRQWWTIIVYPRTFPLRWFFHRQL